MKLHPSITNVSSIDKYREIKFYTDNVVDSKYSYKAFVYRGSDHPSYIYCKTCRKFFKQSSYSHFDRGSGCRTCSYNKNGKNSTKTTETFIKEAKNTHGDKYDYSKTVYYGADVKVKITCPIHGDFEQRPINHTTGSGCSKCSTKRGHDLQRKTTDTFLDESKRIHGDMYDYSETVYLDAKTKVKIICDIHGGFYQKPVRHTTGSGCPKCSYENYGLNIRKDTDWFKGMAKKLHGSKYSYKLSRYRLTHSKVRIICNTCKSQYPNDPKKYIFSQISRNHLQGANCPRCRSTMNSNEEQLISNWLSKRVKIKTSDRSTLKGKELDILIPSKNLAIEYNGLYWHTEDRGKGKNYHLEKTLQSAENGVNLIHIWSHQYHERPLAHKSFLLSNLGLNKNIIYARKTEVREINKQTCTEFLNKYHIQGDSQSKYRYGLFLGEKLLSVMTFGVTRFSKKYSHELLRFCTKYNYTVTGGASKLLAHFVKTIEPESIVSYADYSRSNGNLYEAIGFNFEHLSPPNYWYTKNGMVFSRLKFQKHKLPYILESYDDTLTEVQNVINNGYSRFFDCGNLVYSYIPDHKGNK